MIHRFKRRQAFTLVELLVVIGIIAVLIGILLPALNKARTRAQTVACMSNLRQIFTAARMYAADYHDSLPVGFSWAFAKADGTKVPGTTNGKGDYIAWFTSLDRYMTKGQTDAITPGSGLNKWVDGASSRILAKVFRCPSVDPTFRQEVTYYNHPVAMPSLTLERNPGNLNTGQQPIVPAKFTQLYPDTALFWDTCCWGDAAIYTPSLFWGGGGVAGGWTPPQVADGSDFLPASGIDGDELLYPKYPELRYRGPTGDRFANSTDIYSQPQGPIYWAIEGDLGKVKGSGALSLDANNDSGDGVIWNFAFGGPRWRHNGNTSANVAFADNSVRTLRLTKRVLTSTKGLKGYDNEFLRSFLMIRWPGNQSDSNQIPTG